jgi:MFS family permease
MLYEEITAGLEFAQRCGAAERLSGMTAEGVAAKAASGPNPSLSSLASNTVQTTTWGAILVMALMLLGGGMMRAVFSPLQEAAMLDLKLDDFQISLVQGFAAGFPGALIAMPIAWIIDHGKRVRLLIALIALCVLGTLWTSFCGSFASLFLSRMLAAVGANTAVAVVISLMADMCVVDRRGRALLLLNLGVFGGVALGFALGGILVGALGKHPIGLFGTLAPWRQTHLVVGLIGALGLLPLFLLTEPNRHEVEHFSAKLRPTLIALWSKRAFLIPFFAGQVGVALADTAATIWAAPVLIRNYHLQPEQFSGWVGGVLFSGGLLGAIVGALAADRGQKMRRRGGLLIGAIIAAAIGIPGALFPLMPTVSGFAVLMGLLLVSGTAISLIAATAVTVLIPNEERGVCMAAFGIVNSLFGLGLAPTLVTFGSWAMGGDQHLATSLAVVGIFTGILSLWGYSVAMRSAPLSVAQTQVAT